MTHDQAMLKLLAIEPERRDRLRQITGWAHGETEAVLRRLELAGQIRSQSSINGYKDYRVYRLNDAPSRSRADGDKGPR